MAGGIKTVAFMVVVFASVAFAEDYKVGDDSGWRVPTSPDFYSNWASSKTFRVGDVLEFEFTTGEHDVAVVTKSAYDSCNKANPATLITNGPADVRLNTTGPQYFICTVGSHCSNGQKLTVNVVGGSTGTAPSPGGSTTNTSPSPSGTTTAPPAPNAASSPSGAAGFLVAIMSLALALLS